MAKPAKILTLTATGLLVFVFFFPLWHIQLNAPQYPGGLDMYIWINKITGTDEFTLQNINILNHYIGMRAIHPDSFKELEIMPLAVAGFIILGLITAFINKKWLLAVWLGIMVVGGTVGLLDFYLWQQDFGNNLDPHAPIKIEGMTYSPPFLGEKILLNIEATSYPSLGSAVFGLALLMASLALFKALKKAQNQEKKLFAGGMAACLMLLLVSCKPEPQAIDYGFDSCTHCKMTISDQRYGAELVTQKGKIYKFDAIECLVDYQKNSQEQYVFQLVTDFARPGEFVNAQTAWYLRSEAMPSPMGMNLNAFENREQAEQTAAEKGGELLSWEEVKQLTIGSM